MSQEHKNMPEDGLHEPKGVSTAAVNQVYVSNGSGSGSWKSPLLQGQATSDANSIPVSDGSGGVVWADGRVKSDLSLRGVEYTNQNPTGLNNGLRIKFGTPQDFPDVSIDSLGEITIKELGTYMFTFTGVFGRDTGTGVVTIAARILINGVPSLDPIAVHLDDGKFTIPFSFAFLRTLPSSTKVALEIVRDGGGIDEGGLIAESLAASGWGTTPSAAVSVYRMRVYD